MNGSKPSKLHSTLLPAALFLLTMLVFSRVVTCGFVNFDDDYYITAVPQVTQGLSWHNAAWAFTTNQAANWHPLTWLSLLLDGTLYGDNPGGYHFTNLLFHACNVVLLFLALRNATGSTWRSALIAALHGLRPLRVEGVAWATERKDLLATFFGLLSLLCYLRYARRPHWRTYLPVPLFMALSLLAKAAYVTLPCLLLLLDYWPLRRLVLRASGLPHCTGANEQVVSPQHNVPLSAPPAFPNRSWGVLLLEKVPLFLLGLASGAMTYHVQHSQGALSDLGAYSPAHRLANALISYVRYLGKLVWPVNLAVFYPHPANGWAIWQAAGAGAILLVVTILALARLGRSPWLAVGWFWFLGTLAPMIGLVQSGNQAMADRFSNLASIGLLVMAVFSIPDRVLATPAARRALVTAAAGVLATLCGLTWRQIGFWSNSGTLFEHALHATEPSALAHANLGVYLARQGNTTAAIDHLRKSLALNGTFAFVHYNLGVQLSQTGDRQGAMREYVRAVELKPDYAEALINLGIEQRRTGQPGMAAATLNRALAAEPNSAAAHRNLGLLLGEQGRLEEAVGHFRLALAREPDSGQAHLDLATALARAGLAAEAIAHFTRAVALDPASVDAHFNLGIALTRAGELERAAGEFNAALRLRPDDQASRAALEKTLKAIEQRRGTP